MGVDSIGEADDSTIDVVLLKICYKFSMNKVGKNSLTTMKHLVSQ